MEMLQGLLDHDEDIDPERYELEKLARRLKAENEVEEAFPIGA